MKLEEVNTRTKEAVDFLLAALESGHSEVLTAGSKTRLDRDFGGHRFGSEGYTVEKLVAGLGAAFLCADLELALEPREDHASYIATWLSMIS